MWSSYCVKLIFIWYWGKFVGLLWVTNGYVDVLMLPCTNDNRKHSCSLLVDTLNGRNKGGARLRVLVQNKTVIMRYCEMMEVEVRYSKAWSIHNTTFDSDHICLWLCQVCVGVKLILRYSGAEYLLWSCRFGFYSWCIRSSDLEALKSAKKKSYIPVHTVPSTRRRKL